MTNPHGIYYNTLKRGGGVNVRVFRTPCYFAESVYLLNAFVNHVSFEDEYRRIRQSYSRCLHPEDTKAAEKIEELARVAAQVTQGLNPEDERIRYYFERLSGTERKTGCCLAQVMLMAVPVDCSEIDDFAAQLLSDYRSMQVEGIKINDLNALGLVMERWDAPGEPEPLAAQLERLSCSMEAKWQILRALTDFEHHLRELTELIRPVAERLHGALKTIVAMNEENFAQWSQYFTCHTVDDFQNEMFDTSFLFAEENLPHEIWLGIWYFNLFAAWSEWMERPSGRVRLAYIGMCISFELSTKRKDRPDAETLCGMARVLGSKDKLEILRRCNQGPISAARLADAMNLNSGTVSRNLYGLFKLGYLDTKGDGERVNYVTRLDTMEQVFQWILEYVTDTR